MQKRIADIIADILVEHGITDIFSLVGGGAMFLNDAFGHHEGLRVMYNQHEQACSMAAEGYVRATAGWRLSASPPDLAEPTPSPVFWVPIRTITPCW